MELLVTSGSTAAQRASGSRHGHRLHVDLDTASVQQLATYAEQEFKTVVVMVSTWAALRHAVLPLRLLGSSKDIRVRVLEERVARTAPPAPWPSLSGRLVEFTCKSDAEEGSTVRVRSSRPTPLAGVVGFLVRNRAGLLSVPLRVALTRRDVEAFAVGNPSVRYLDHDDEVDTGGVTVPLTEFVLAPADASDAPGTVASDDSGRLRLSVATGDARPADGPVDPSVWFPPVDSAVVNPMGLDLRAGNGEARGGVGADGFAQVLDAAGQPLLRVPARAALARDDVARARQCRFVSWHDEGGDPVGAAALLCQLAAAGIPVVARGLTPVVSALLGSALTAALADCRDEDMDDPLLREAASIRLRRSALRAHGTGPRMRQLAQRVGHALPDEPGVSVILLTKRPHLVRDALRQLARQSYPNVQVVLGLHGDGFDPVAVEAAIGEVPRPTVVVHVPADVAFGEALNRATARCDGRLVAKWDDDDLYGTEHLWDLVLAADYSGATVVGKAAEFTVVTDAATTVRRSDHGSERFTRHVAGGTILLRREDLQAVGGWRQQPRYVDDALLRQVRDAGGTIYRTHGFGYLLVRHDEGHTWDPGTAYFLRGDAPRWPSDSPLQQVALEQATQG